MINLISNSEIETKEFAKKIAKQLNNNSVIVLEGDLGAGKTKFTEGILEYFNLADEISSPTFTIVNEYNSKNINIYHFDVYRLSDIDEFYAIGGDEYFGKGICIIEWGEIVEKAIPKDHIKIKIERNFENENSRNIKIQLFGNANLEI